MHRLCNALPTRLFSVSWRDRGRRAACFDALNGRHIVDCGHDTYNAEIHPADTVVSIRSGFGGSPVLGIKPRKWSFAAIWANALFVGPVTFTIPAPPRPHPSAKLYVLTHKPDYFLKKGFDVTMDVVDEGLRVTISKTNDNIWNQIRVPQFGPLVPFVTNINADPPTRSTVFSNGDGVWFYPQGDTPEYMDYVALTWRDPS